MHMSSKVKGDLVLGLGPGQMHTVGRRSYAVASDMCHQVSGGKGRIELLNKPCQ